jgi:hypothetical protein
MSLDEYYALNKQQSATDLDFVRLGPDKTVQYYVPPRNYKVLSDVSMDVRTSGKIRQFTHEKHEELMERIIGGARAPEIGYSTHLQAPVQPALPHTKSVAAGPWSSLESIAIH